MKRIGLTVAMVLILGNSYFAQGHDGHSKHDPAKQGFSKHDSLRIAVQGICPVTGEKLGDHGQPIKVKAGQEEIFLCCKGCLSEKINAKHWATIHANAARAQGMCPVMKKKLPANPKSVVVNGQTVYVCCPPCTKKIATNPGPFLATIDTYYEQALKTKQR